MYPSQHTKPLRMLCAVAILENMCCRSLRMASGHIRVVLGTGLCLTCLLLFSPTAALAAESESQGLVRGNEVVFNQTSSSQPLGRNLPLVPEAGAIRSKRSKRSHRKLLQSCTKSDISIFQGPSSPLPSGIPTFNVQIFNLCAVDCPISNVHISCGWFASANLVLPNTFRRVRYNDCLLNDGKPIRAGTSVYFQYSNSFEYPLEVKFVQNCRRY